MTCMRARVNKQVQSCCLLSTPGIAKSPLIRRTCSTQVRAVHDTRATRAVHLDVFTARRHAMLPSGGFATPLSKWRNLPNAISQSGRYSYSTAPVDVTQPVIHDVFESNTGTWQYVVADPATKAAVIIDPVLDYDRTTQIITTSSADELLRLVKEKSYRVLRILETHAHADHLTAASYLQKRIAEEHGNKPQIGIGRRIGQVQDLFGQRYDVSSQERHGVFDKLFEDDESFSIGHLSATAIHLPGHTPDHLGYKIGDNVFCGDSLFHVDIGTARCDFPGGSANNLYHSGRRLLSLPDHVKVWTGHDYPPDDREGPVPWMTVSDHRKLNKHLRDGITEEEFVAQRKERDAKLGEPKLLHQSLQTNIRAGKLPQPTASGHRMLRVPIKLGDLQW
ncbi:metallo-beta-lactamase superfamily protein [Colletotrichum scovillei]|uniref:Metallo-beta-lactamase domain protein n=1 Tax=Colletotrichum scovillei TaxID=1209932 RepID=A0A9P7R2B4_9PEZI|nr:metallo-beta-lactamase superfamily protein [Colletotrichum scovillei]KAF4779072.1 metallo-beta-lactamase superfamily protein [Colletotrichum scovillei]KAG7047203.1 putative metallo-beta-lactamase domain protein [Colletotrichum scovillei]KAG7057055.1 putative metallo-beta-lactamase domain protein [Colletotrichum scovillei]KAG7066970.1 putative metallo-beta-lactamase domain protein [Colletotrichum scovillei]